MSLQAAELNNAETHRKDGCRGAKMGTPKAPIFGFTAAFLHSGSAPWRMGRLCFFRSSGLQQAFARARLRFLINSNREAAHSVFLHLDSATKKGAGYSNKNCKSTLARRRNMTALVGVDHETCHQFTSPVRKNYCVISAQLHLPHRCVRSLDCSLYIRHAIAQTT